MRRWSRSIVIVLLLLQFFPYPGMGESEDPSRDTVTWTILSYMSGDNELDGFLIDDLNEMERAASENVNIVVQIDRREDHGSSNGDWTDTRRYLVQPDDTDDIASLRIDDPGLGELDMNDPAVLRDFLEWGLTNYPADHYMVVLEGHADGPVKGLLKDSDSSLGYKNMKTSEMGSAFREAVDSTIGRPVDVISFDVCYMGMVETAAEVMDHAEYFMGSVDYVPAAGWPYDLCLPIIYSGTGTLEERLRLVVDEFYNGYSGPDGPDYISQSLIYLPDFRDSFVPAWERLSTELFYTAFEQRSFYESLIAPLDKPTEKDGSVYNDRYIDSLQFARYLRDDVRTPELVRIAAARVLETQDEFELYHLGGPSHSEEASLLGIYMPEEWDSPVYGDLVISKLTPWDDLVRLYVRELDLRAQSRNWSTSRPSTIPFVLRTATPDGITNAWVEVKSPQGYHNVTLIGYGGHFNGTLQVPETDTLRFRYRIGSIYGGTIDLPPDGHKTIRFSHEGTPPELMHEPPSTTRIGLEGGGLIFHIRDNTGIEIEDPEKVPRLEYWEDPETPYSIPLVRRTGNIFTGWVEYWALPTGMTPGEPFHYRVVVEDILGNSMAHPEGSNWTSRMGIGSRFYLDAARSHSGEHQGLIDTFQDMGMAVEQHMDASQMEDLSPYKGYILIEPTGQYPQSDVVKVLEFLEQGGEVLVVMDPSDQEQSTAAAMLFHDLKIDPSPEGSISGFYPANPSSELGSDVPPLAGSSTGSFLLSEGQRAVYYATPPNSVLYTDWHSKGRMVIAHSSILDDDVIDRTSNGQLAELIVSYLYQNMLPVPVLSIEPDDLIASGEKVTFNMTGSFDPDGEITEYELHISDGTALVGPDPVVEHVFIDAGLYSVTLKVHDAEDGWTSLSSSIRINNPATTDHSVSATKTHAGEEITFSYKGHDPEGDTYIVEWDFGDGYKVTGKVVDHAYRTKGEFMYTVRTVDIWGMESIKTGIVIIENSDPVIDIDRSEILVNGAPAEFSGELMVTLYMEEGDTVTIPAGGSYDPDLNDDLNFSWSMGDGTVLHGSEVEHTYTTSGLLTMNLTLTDGFGGSDHYTLTIKVSNKAPFAAFEWKEDGGNVHFDGSLSTDDEWDLPGLVYRWDFGDGETATTTEPEVYHDYTFGGRYTVTLEVIDGDGDTSEFKQEIVVSGIRFTTTVILLILLIVVLVSVAVFFYFRRQNTMTHPELEEGQKGNEESARVRKIRAFTRPEPASRDTPKRLKFGEDRGKG
ncbi:MAG: PKD domain-containing protein [Thermoplasmatota archaeon]